MRGCEPAHLQWRDPAHGLCQCIHVHTPPSLHSCWQHSHGWTCLWRTGMGMQHQAQKLSFRQLAKCCSQILGRPLTARSDHDTLRCWSTSPKWCGRTSNQNSHNMGTESHDPSAPALARPIWWGFVAFALEHAVFLWNNLPKSAAGPSPVEILTGVVSPDRSNCFASFHVWGCPGWVLDPKPQDGKKLPEWHKQSQCGMHLGISSKHLNAVGDILNLCTGHITLSVMNSLWQSKPLSLTNSLMPTLGTPSSAEVDLNSILTPPMHKVTLWHSMTFTMISWMTMPPQNLREMNETTSPLLPMLQCLLLPDLKILCHHCHQLCLLLLFSSPKKSKSSNDHTRQNCLDRGVSGALMATQTGVWAWWWNAVGGPLAWLELLVVERCRDACHCPQVIMQVRVGFMSRSSHVTSLTHTWHCIVSLLQLLHLTCALCCCLSRTNTFTAQSQNHKATKPPVLANGKDNQKIQAKTLNSQQLHQSDWSEMLLKMKSTDSKCTLLNFHKQCNPDSQLIKDWTPHAHAAEANNMDNPNWNQAMNGSNAKGFWEACHTEIRMDAWAHGSLGCG